MFHMILPFPVSTERISSMVLYCMLRLLSSFLVNQVKFAYHYPNEFSDSLVAMSCFVLFTCELANPILTS